MRAKERKCPACNGPYDSDDRIWIQCEGCQVWYHASCSVYDGYTEELENETFVCADCEEAMPQTS